MQKKIYRVIVNMLIFITFASFMPGVVVGNGPAGHIIAGLGYSLIFIAIKNVLVFFKLPLTMPFRLGTGMIVVCAYLGLLATQTGSFFTMTKGYIGNIDLILFKIPKIMVIDNQTGMVITSAIILLGCSIIMEKLKK